MIAAVDTSALLGLLTQRDQWHDDAKATYRLLVKRKLAMCIPRIVMTETLGHLARITGKFPKHERGRILGNAVGQLDALQWNLIEHSPADYSEARQIAVDYADWPIGYADAIIIQTIRSEKLGCIWTYDANDLAPVLRRVLPKVEIFGPQPQS